jgi:hypothetical protein
MDFKGIGLDIEKELKLGFSLPSRSEGLRRDLGKLPMTAIPPPPPAKDLPKRPAPLKLDPPTLTSSPSQPPTRPLPPRPTPKPSDPTLRFPPPTRKRSLRPQGPLTMNPPTRPGTAASQSTASQASGAVNAATRPGTAASQGASPVPGATGTIRFPGSTRRLSWTSIASRRPIKYGTGKHSGVELVPQPSDDPDDPLVCPALL